jgi:transposase-like protein
MGPVVRYSEAFKLQVVRELEGGRFGNPGEAGRAYGVRGPGTVASWVRRYGKDELLRKVVRVMKADEQAEVKGLRQRVRELERALADAHLKGRFDEAYLRLACRAAGIEDVDGFKKKHGGTL